MEDVLNTWRELLRNEWLSFVEDDNSNLVPAVMGRSIKAWWHGDREIITGNDLPAMAIDSESMTPDWSAFRTQEQEYNFDVLCYVRETDPDDSKSVIHEFARIVKRITEKQSRWWVFSPCLFNSQIFYDPQYLIDHFSIILSSYFSQVELDYEADWAIEHTAYNGVPNSSLQPMALREKDRYVAAYLKLFYEDPLISPWATTPFTYVSKEGITYTTTPKDIITLARNEEVVPARFMSDARIKNINYGYVMKGAQLLYGAQISIYSKEQWPISNFGPK